MYLDEVRGTLDEGESTSGTEILETGCMLDRFKPQKNGILNEQGIGEFLAFQEYYEMYTFICRLINLRSC